MYLSGGDIDLMALGKPDSETEIADAICSLLKSEEENKNVEVTQYRIQSAFRYGVRKLDQILLLPQNQIAQGVGGFFTNIVERHPVGGSHLQVNALDQNGPASSNNSMIELDSITSLKGKQPVSYLAGKLCSRISKMKVSGTMLESTLRIISGPLRARAELYGIIEEVIFSSIQAVGVTQYMARSALHHQFLRILDLVHLMLPTFYPKAASPMN